MYYYVYTDFILFFIQNKRNIFLHVKHFASFQSDIVSSNIRRASLNFVSTCSDNYEVVVNSIHFKLIIHLEVSQNISEITRVQFNFVTVNKVMAFISVNLICMQVIINCILLYSDVNSNSYLNKNNLW